VGPGKGGGCGADAVTLNSGRKALRFNRLAYQTVCGVKALRLDAVTSPRGPCFAHPVLSLYAFRWDPAELDRIWPRVGITPESSWDDVIADASLTTRFPGAF
jgi:hypothetical protein